MSRRIAVLIAAASVIAATAAASSVEDDSTSAALTWLHLVDAGEFAGSWAGASSLFQNGVSEARWVEMVKSVRTRLGQLKSRQLNGVNFTKTLPGVPDGDYAVIRFNASYSNKAEAIEAITLVREGSAWKAGGYFIQ